MNFSPTIRLFVSSTFSDLKAERNVLQDEVFPRLRQLCLTKGFRFQAIDLRWGISEEAGRDNKTMRICLRELRRCQQDRPKPNFLILLGDRYGWRPLPEIIPAALFAKMAAQLEATHPNAGQLLQRWYRLDKNAVPPVHELQARGYPKIIPAALFETLAAQLEATHSGATRRLQLWYRLDEKAVPPVYELQPRGDDETWVKQDDKPLLSALEQACWKELVETPLLAALGEAAQTLGLKLEKEGVSIGTSATEQEIIEGALKVPDAASHVRAFFRTIDGMPDAPPPKDYVDIDDPQARTRLDALKDHIQSHLGNDNVCSYRVSWRGDGINRGDLKEFRDQAWKRLSEVVKQQIAALTKVPPEVLEEQAHQDFGAERRHGFVGRDEPLKRMADYLIQGSDQPLAVIGPSGSGKSALMAKAVQAAVETNPKAKIIARYIGATPASSDLIQLLRNLVATIRQRYPATVAAEPASGEGGRAKPGDAEVPFEFKTLVSAFHDALTRPAADQSLFLFLDSLDQLTANHQAHALTWLPGRLSEHVRLVVSAALAPKPGPGVPSASPEATDPRAAVMAALESRLGAGQSVTLVPLSVADGEQMLTNWLDDAHRTLQTTQRQAILATFQVEGSPLWLRTATEEAARLASWQPAPSFASTTPRLLGQVLDRLSQEDEHGAMMVSRTLSYLACARHGLAEDEILDILGADPEVMADFLRRSPTERSTAEADRVKALPVAVWVRLHGDLAFYLAEHHVQGERQAQGASLLGFYHRSFLEAVTAYCLSQSKDRRLRHQSLAQYFHREADPERCGRWNGLPRGLTELSYHLFASAQQEALAGLWESIPYLDARASDTDVYELTREFGWLQTPGEAPREYHDVLARHTQQLWEHRGMFFGLLRHEGSARAVACCDELVRTGRWYKPWISTQAVWLPAPAMEEQALSVTVRNSFRFDECAAATMTDPVSLVFYVKRLGTIGVADPVAGREYLGDVICRQTPVRRICASSDGRRLGVAYADGNAELIAIEFAPDGSWLKQRPIAAFRLLVPEVELPFLYWGSDRLLCQKEDGGLALVSPAGDEERLVIGEDCRGELSGAVFIAGQWVITLRQGPDTRILACSNDRVSFSMLRPAADVTAITGAGQDRVAIGFSDNHLLLFRLSGGMAVEQSLARSHWPIAAAGNPDRLIWIENNASAYSWNPDTEKLPLQLRAPGVFSSGLSFFRPSRMVLHADDTLWVLTQSSIHSLITGAANPPGFPVCEVLVGATEAIYAIQKREDNYWVVDSTRRRECCVVDRNPVRQYFAMNEHNQLLAATDTGGAVWTDLETLQSMKLPSMPPAINSVVPAGDGFWLADRSGGIFHLGRNKTCAEMMRIPLSSLAGGALCSWPGTLLWHGVSSEQGDSNLYLILFSILMDAPRNITPLGQRVVTKSDGVFQAICRDAATGELILILAGNTRCGVCAKVGTPKQFLSHEEREYALDIAGGITYAAMSPRGEAVFLLSNAGKLVVLDRATFRARSTLVSNGRFTRLAGCSSGRGTLAVVESGWRVFTCDEGERHEQ